jgi:hypothetical protein
MTFPCVASRTALMCTPDENFQILFLWQILPDFSQFFWEA